MRKGSRSGRDAAAGKAGDGELGVCGAVVQCPFKASILSHNPSVFGMSGDDSCIARSWWHAPQSCVMESFPSAVVCEPS
jgi:hypothetical protein